MRCGYTKEKIPRYIPHVKKMDRARLTTLSSKPNQFHEEAFHTVVITTKKCYQVHVKDVFDKLVQQKRKQIKKCAIATFGWGRVCVNEAHKKVHAGGQALEIVQRIEGHVWKWMVTGTPFETSPDQMAYWIKALENSLGWVKTLQTDDWSRQKKYRERLSTCGFCEVVELGKCHSRLIEKRETNQAVIDEHTNNLSVLLQTLWLQQNAETSTFFGHKLTTVLPDKNEVVECLLPAKFEKAVNKITRAIGNKITTSLSQAIQTWENNCRDDRPMVRIIHWLDKMRRMRILSTFPRLNSLEVTSELKLIGQQDFDNGWLKNADGRLYELFPVNSLYEQNIKDICSPEHCTKLAAVSALIAKWGRNEKAVFCTMCPTNALILYWVNVIQY